MGWELDGENFGVGWVPQEERNECGMQSVKRPEWM
jgi:hypothetical protein